MSGPLAGPLLMSPLSARAQTSANGKSAAGSTTFGSGDTRVAVLVPPKGGPFDRATACLIAGIKAAHSVDGSNITVETVPLDDEPDKLAAALEGFKSRGFAFVIGPMTRNGANALQTLGDAPLPTLALNLPDGDLPASSRALFFGLAIETEARQAAGQAFAQALALAAGRKPRATAMVADSRLALRSAVAFSDEWLSLGGELTEPIEFSGTRVPRDLRTRLAAEPPDAVFLAMTVEQARLVRREFPRNLILWSTSLASVGNLRNNRSPELDGLRLLDMPWHTQPDHPAVMAYPKAPSAYSAEMHRLYALGIDAFRVSRQMMSGETAFDLDGVTGRLRYDRNQGPRIDRTSVPAEYRGGRPVALRATDGA